jgi:lysophospholipase L1-like esterase
MVKGRFAALFLGDSVVWGQGLREEDKFSTWVVQWLNEFHPDLHAFKNVKAHSGAIIGSADDDAEGPGWNGEVPHSFPSIHRQVAAYDDSDPQDVDLIVVNGGLNDVNCRTIFNPKTAPDKLREKISDASETRMTALLLAIGAKFPNPKTKVLVAGYYPIVSHDSRPAGVIPMMTALGAATPGPTGWNPWRTIVENSLLFEAHSGECMQQSVATANIEFPGRFIWVKPAILPINSAFAPLPWIYGVRLPHIAPEDDIAKDRELMCKIQPDGDLRALCLRASVGHPNRWGAKAYFNAIYPILQKEYGF